MQYLQKEKNTQNPCLFRLSNSSCVNDNGITALHKIELTLGLPEEALVEQTGRNLQSGSVCSKLIGNTEKKSHDSRFQYVTDSFLAFL